MRVDVLARFGLALVVLTSTSGCQGTDVAEER